MRLNRDHLRAPGIEPLAQAAGLTGRDPRSVDPGEEVGAVTRPRVEMEPLLTPAEVAVMFGVDTRTVTRWARSGQLTTLRTVGGHRRYREQEVRTLLSARNDPYRSAI
jgi:excisionase family DNA binding protein